MLWEDAVEEAYEWKSLRYAELAADAPQCGVFWPVEVGCRGIVATSTSRLLREMGVQARSSSERSRQSSWKQQPVALDKVEGFHLGTQVSNGIEGVILGCWTLWRCHVVSKTQRKEGAHFTTWSCHCSLHYPAESRQYASHVNCKGY